MDNFVKDQLLSTLRLVRSGLGKAVPQSSRFWFDGAQVFSFREDLGVTADLKTEFIGGVEGEMLYKLVNVTIAEQVEFESDGQKLKLTMGRTRPTLPIDDIETCGWEMPQAGNNPLSVDTTKLVSGVEHCLRSIGNQLSVPESLGVTLVAGKKDITLYSATDTAMSKAVVPLTGKSPDFGRATLPHKFCDQMIEVASDKRQFELQLTAEYALLVGEDFSIYGPLLSTDKPMDFEREFARALNDCDCKPIPKKLPIMLDNAGIVAKNSRIELKVEKEDKKNVLSIYTESDTGQVEDNAPFDRNHPVVNVVINREDLEAGCRELKFSALTHIGITKDSVILTTEDKSEVLIIGTMQGP